MQDSSNPIEPFKFFTRLHLSELTGLKATNLYQLFVNIKRVPSACIYHHTHRFLQQHQYLSPEPPNDFAYWVSEVLNEDGLGEKLASIDTVHFTNIKDLRDEIINTIENYLLENPKAKRKLAYEGEEFHFIKSISYILPTKYIANNLREFIDILKVVTIDSIYFHIFEARLRLEKKTNDFSLWLGTNLGHEDIAKKISSLDPYTFTMEDLRKKIINICEIKLKENA